MSSSGPLRSSAARASLFAATFIAFGAFGGAVAIADGAPAGTTPDAQKREEIVKVVEELRIEASKLRGLAWKHDVPSDLLTRDQLKKHLEAMIEEEFKPDEYARDKKILQRMGLLSGDEDPLEMTKRFLEQGIAGFYNPKTKRLYIVDGLSVDAQRPTMLHELIHALEDQYIDLETRQKAVEKDSDALFAMKCTIEGSAERARKLYEKAHPDIAKRSHEEQAKAQNAEELGKTMKATPAFLYVPSLLHYQTGPALVTRYVGSDYPGGMAKMYAGDSPSTQEQCLHPGRFVTSNRDLPRAITWPEHLAEAAGGDWKGLEAQVTGELDFALWMSHWLGHNKGRLTMDDAGSGRMWAKEAGVAAEGWDGMKVQVFEQGGKPTGVALASAWDTRQDAKEAGDALEASLRAQFEGDFAASPSRDAEGGGRVLDFTDRYGTGRLLVRDDVVLLLDGFPKATFGAVWALLSATKFTRDAKDTWTAAANVDRVTKAAWKSGDVGWELPDEMWVADEVPDAFSKGDLSFRLAVEKGSLPAAVMKYFVEAKRASPDANIDMRTISEISVSEKEAARVDYEDPKAGVTRTLIFVVTEGAVIVIRASAPTASWRAAAADLGEALDAFVFKD